MSYAPATNPPTSSKDGPLDAQTVEILQGGPPFDDDNDPWLGVGLRALLRSHGYRLRTLRDVALQCAADNGTAVPKKWGGPAREDDDPWLPSLVHRSVASAHLLHDQLRIFLKIINTATQEADIYRYLRLGDRSIAEDPLNKTIPMLDILLLPVPGRAVVVMYEWSEVWFYPSVVTWAQYKGFMRETLEVGLQSRIQFVPGGQYLEMLNIQGLAFMHSHLIAHLDITNGNILTGPPGCDFSSPSARHYAYVDFQYSVRFPRDHKGPMTVVGAIATEPAPEQNDLVPYDPFCTDVWQLGRLFESDVEDRELLLKPHLAPLLDRMTAESPEQRPTAAEALQYFREHIEPFDLPYLPPPPPTPITALSDGPPKARYRHRRRRNRA